MLLVAVFLTIAIVSAVAGGILVYKNKEVFFSKQL